MLVSSAHITDMAHCEVICGALTVIVPAQTSSRLQKSAGRSPPGLIPAYGQQQV